MKKIVVLFLAIVFFVNFIPFSEAEENPLNVSEEGYIFEREGCFARVAWCKEEQANIFGRLYFPADFNETMQYTTIVICHGGKLTCDFQDKFYAPALARMGYVCYAFDCRSATESGRGTFSDPLESGEADGVSYTRDFEAALAYVKSLPYVDQNNIYLFGQSLGGIAAESTGAKHSEDIAGLIVLYGCLSDNLADRLADYHDVKANPYHSGEVLFIQGMKDQFNSEADVIENMTWYDECSFVLLTKGPHGFGFTGDRPAQICVNSIDEFIKCTHNE